MRVCDCAWLCHGLCACGCSRLRLYGLNLQDFTVVYISQQLSINAPCILTVDCIAMCSLSRLPRLEVFICWLKKGRWDDGCHASTHDAKPVATMERPTPKAGGEMAWRRATAEAATPRNCPRAAWMFDGSRIVKGVDSKRLWTCGCCWLEHNQSRAVPAPRRRATESYQARSEET